MINIKNKHIKLLSYMVACVCLGVLLHSAYIYKTKHCNFSINVLTHKSLRNKIRVNVIKDKKNKNTVIVIIADKQNIQ